MQMTLQNEMALWGPSNSSLSKEAQVGLHLMFRAFEDSRLYSYDEYELAELESDQHTEFDQAEGARYLGTLGALVAAHRLIGYTLDGADTK